MSERISLKDYQRELAERFKTAQAGGVLSMLGVQIDDEAWLVDLKEAGEVIPVPAITPLPLTRTRSMNRSWPGAPDGRGLAEWPRARNALKLA